MRWICRAGYAARGIIFIVSGFFVFSAGLEDRASGAGGIQEALRWLDSPVDLLVAGGLLLFGLFSILEAWFRVIHQVPLDELPAPPARRRGRDLGACCPPLSATSTGGSLLHSAVTVLLARSATSHRRSSRATR